MAVGGSGEVQGCLVHLFGQGRDAMCSVLASAFVLASPPGPCLHSEPPTLTSLPVWGPTVGTIRQWDWI